MKTEPEKFMVDDTFQALETSAFQGLLVVKHGVVTATPRSVLQSVRSMLRFQGRTAHQVVVLKPSYCLSALFRWHSNADQPGWAVASPTGI